MIFLFRKEIQKWNKIWWVVIASLALGSVSFFFMRSPDKSSVEIASVNGQTVSLKTYHQTFAEMKSSLDDLAMYWGIPIERLAKMMGMNNMPQAALSQCIQNILLDDVTGNFSIQIDAKSLQEFLASTISKAFIDRFGKINLQAYQNYLSRMQMTISDYENRKEKEFKRNAVVKFLTEAGYVPTYVAKGKAAQKTEKKSFSMLSLQQKVFVDLARKKEASQDDLKAFYKEKKESYRIGAKRKAMYWAIMPEEYKEKVDVDDDAIERFYEKNKSSLYRIPPKIKIRVIVLTVGENASPDLLQSVRNQANNLAKQAQQDPENFAGLAKQHSQDAKTAKNGGLTDFFQRGTRDPELEKIAFIKLKEPGEVSDVVRTKRGFEIIQLEDRISAAEKPLAEVRDDIIKTVKDRKALIVLRGDMESVVRTARTDETIFEKFAGANNFKGTQTDWLTQDDTSGYELPDVLAQKLFSGEQGRAQKFGYFVHRGSHVLYKVNDVQESYIPSYENVKQAVSDDWYKEKAKTLQQETVKRLRKELFSSGASVKVIAEREGFDVITTPLIKIDSEVEALKDAGTVIDEAFALTDPSQVLPYKNITAEKTDYYLIKLMKIEKDEPAAAEEEFLSESLKSGEKQRFLNAFIASLQRNATIETREDIVQSMAR